MKKVPFDIWSQYDAVLKAKVKDVLQHKDLKKWFLYFWDFCAKYHPPGSRSEQVRLFVEKLHIKGNLNSNKKQAAFAVSLYFQMQDRQPVKVKDPQTLTEVKQAPVLSSHVSEPVTLVRNKSRFSEWRCLEKSGSPEWDNIISDLSNETKTRHYSRKTLKAYGEWVRKFQRFLHDKQPADLSKTDVKEYLTYLAVKCKVAASRNIGTCVHLFQRFQAL